jgi:hypothetical protein
MYVKKNKAERTHTGKAPENGLSYASHNAIDTRGLE